MRVFHYSPFPPTPSGIADYADRVTREIHRRVNIAAVTDNPLTSIGDLVDVYDIEQAWRFKSRGDVSLYQIGNNAQHASILKEAIRDPGVVVLHDLKLLYLHESSGLSPEEMRTKMMASNPYYGASRAEAISTSNLRLTLDYMALDMLWDVMHRSKGIVVHSEFAKKTLIRTYGAAFSDRVHVIPHFSIETEQEERATARQRLGLPKDIFLIVTSGFATGAKRLDWMADALSRLAERGFEFEWVHVGRDRGDDFDLSRLVRQYPALNGRYRSTGYVDETTLNRYIAAANLLANLRYPSVGESSGSLARSFAAGRCSLVTDTAGYSEFPSNVVIKIPYVDAVAHLECHLKVLLNNQGVLPAFEKNARQYAKDKLSISSYCKSLADVLKKAINVQPLSDGDVYSARRMERDRLELGDFPVDELDGDTLAAQQPVEFLTNSYRFDSSVGGQVRVSAGGASVARKGKK